jgi:hypothetical protein
LLLSERGNFHIRSLEEAPTSLKPGFTRLSFTPKQSKYAFLRKIAVQRYGSGGTSQALSMALRSSLYSAKTQTSWHTRERHDSTNIRSKTALTLTDYLLSLRANIKLDPVRQHEYIDTAAHWKNLWQQSQVELHHLQGKNAALTKENKALQSNGAKGRKRKANEDLITFRRMTRSQDLPAETQTDTLIHDIGDVEELTDSEVVLYHIFVVDEAFKQEPINEEGIAAHLFEAAHKLYEMLDAICLQLSTNPPPTSKTHGMNDEAGDTKELADLRAFERVYGLILRYLAALEATQDSTFGPVVHKCVLIFQRLLDWITIVSKGGQVTTDSRCETIRTAAAHALPKVARNRLNTILAKALLDLTSFLTPNCGLHFQIFEGFTFVVVQRSGSLLYTLTFGHDRSSNIEQEIEDDQYTFAKNTTSETDDAKIASTEVKYVFKVLKMIMTLAPQFYQARSSSVAERTRSDSVGPKRSSPSKLPLDAKQKLQVTLLKCIWDEKRSGVDVADCLSMPVLTGPLPTLPKGYTQPKSQSWFTGELWKLIGWDILGRQEICLQPRN